MAKKFSKIIYNTKSPWSPNGRISLQRIKDKLAHNHAWSVMSSRVNHEKQQFEFTMAKGPVNVVTQVISFADAWAEFGWDGVKMMDKGKSNEGVIPIATYDDGTKF